MRKFDKRKKYMSGIQETLRKNVLKLLTDKHVTQKMLSISIGKDEAQLSRILRGQGNFTLEHVEKIAIYFALRPIDLFTWPDIYVRPDGKDSGPAEVLLQLRLTKEKKDQVLKLVFGENNIEILNK